MNIYVYDSVVLDPEKCALGISEFNFTLDECYIFLVRMMLILYLAFYME